MGRVIPDNYHHRRESVGFGVGEVALAPGNGSQTGQHIRGWNTRQAHRRHPVDAILKLKSKTGALLDQVEVVDVKTNQFPVLVMENKRRLAGIQAYPHRGMGRNPCSFLERQRYRGGEQCDGTHQSKHQRNEPEKTHGTAAK